MSAFLGIGIPEGSKTVCVSTDSLLRSKLISRQFRLTDQTRREQRAYDMINAGWLRLFPSFKSVSDGISMLKQYASDESYASHQYHHANLHSLDVSSDRPFRQVALERAEHILQFRKPAGAVAFGDGGIDRFR